MSTPMLVNDVWQSTVACYANGQVSLNRYLWLAAAQAGGGGTDAQLAVDLDTLLAPLYKACMAATATYYGVKVSRYVLPPVARPQISNAFIGVGTAGAEAFPTAVCGLMKKTSYAWGKKGQGRTYIPFPSTTLADTNGEPSAGYEVNVGAIATALLTLNPVGVGGNTTELLWVLPDVKFHPGTAIIVSSVAEAKWGTQHKRGDFGKLNQIPPW